MVNILFIGDIVGHPGRKAVQYLLPSLKDQYKIDFTIANGENAAGGFGIVSKVSQELFSYGINVITMGNHMWDKKEILDIIDKEERILKPANYPVGTPGHKNIVVELADGKKIAVINLLGRVYMNNLECPFRTAKQEINKLKKEASIIIIDFHAEVTSEKRAFGWFIDGEVSAVFGTHTHVQTSDEQILPNGTAYITDAGMTGAFDSVIGIKKELAMEKFLLQMPKRFDVATDDIRLDAAVIEVDEKTGKAIKIERIERKYNKEKFS